MYRARGAHPQRGRGGVPGPGRRGGPDGRTYSGSSANSGSSGSVLKSHKQPSEGSEYSTYNLNGHNITETHKARPNANDGHNNAPFPVKENNRPQSSIFGAQHTQTKSLVKRDNESWALDQEARIKLMGIPKSCWTKDVYLAMSKYGAVIRIDMMVGSRSNDATVTMQSPTNALPKKFVNIRSYQVRYEKIPSNPPTIASPVDPRKKYFELNIFFAKSLDFGTRTAYNESVNMHAVKAEGKVQMTLDLKRKEIDIRFPLYLDNTINKYRFRMPFSILPNIFRVVEEATGQIALIIPFDSPPQFFVQKKPVDDGDESSFPPNDMRWIEWNTWFRETDVVDGQTRKQMKLMPISNHRESAIIDIGEYTSIFFSS